MLTEIVPFHPYLSALEESRWRILPPVFLSDENDDEDEDGDEDEDAVTEEEHTFEPDDEFDEEDFDDDFDEDFEEDLEEHELPDDGLHPVNEQGADDEDELGNDDDY
jgi:hypothetical protein